MKNTKKHRKPNFKKIFIYYFNVLSIGSFMFQPMIDYSFKLFIAFYCFVWIFWTFVDITSEAHKL